MTRTDAAVKLAGKAVYGMDLETDGMLHAALVPAPVTHGTITRLDLRPARQTPGVVVAIGPKELRSLLANGGGDPDRPLFPTTEIMYRHQPIAAVAAESIGAARAGARAVVVEAKERDAATEIDALFPEWPERAIDDSPYVTAHVRARHGDVEGALRTADFVHAETYRTSGIHQMAIEPHACLAEVRDGTWKVRTTTQSPFGVREDTAALLGVPESNVVVDGTWVGGGFGGKAAAFLEPYALALAAASDRPVRLALTYREEFLLGRTTLPAVLRLDTAVKDGKITARRVRLLLDTGASLPGRDFAAGYAIGFLLGPYRVGAFDLEGYALRTNKPPFGPHRAPFIPQCAFVAESHLDGLARRLGVDPIAFRRDQCWREGDTTPLGQAVTSFGLSEALQRAQKIAATWRRTIGTGEGIGIGCGFWSTGTGAGGEARLRLTPEAVLIEQGEREIGSGSVERGLVAVAERVLGLPAEAIRVVSLDTGSAPFDSGVFGSRTVGALGQAVQKASVELLRSLAIRRRTEGPVRLVYRDGRIEVADGIGRASVESMLTPVDRAAGGIVAAGKHYGESGRLDESRVVAGSFYPYNDYTASVHVAQVSVNRETGQVRVVRGASILDVGVAIDREMITAQVEGGYAMGLGAALTEEMLWQSDGRLANPHLLDYRVPTIRDIPPLTVDLVEGFAGAGPFGAKGVGEPPIIPVAAAVANAVADATGVRVFELPLTPERVARALKLL